MSEGNWEHEIAITDMYNFVYRVNETDIGNTPNKNAFVALLSFENTAYMSGFGGDPKSKPGLKIEANNVWLTTGQVDELITALLYWRKEYGDPSV